MDNNQRIDLENVESIKAMISKAMVTDAVKKDLGNSFRAEDIDYALDSFDFVVKCKRRSQVSYGLEDPSGGLQNNATTEEINEQQSQLETGPAFDETILLEGGKKSSLYLRKVITQDYYQLLANTTVAKLNKNGKYYWANPPIEYIDDQWILILNDMSSRVLKVFDIPANSVDREKVKTRVKDGKVLIDLEIEANSKDYVCHASKIPFGKWYKESFQY